MIIREETDFYKNPPIHFYGVFLYKGKALINQSSVNENITELRKKLNSIFLIIPLFFFTIFSN